MIKHFIKKSLPRGLYWRTFLIIVIPIVLLQLVTAYVVYDRHLGSVTKTLSTVLANEIHVAVKTAKENPNLAKSLAKNLDIKYIFHTKRKLPIFQPKLSLPWIDNYLIVALKERLAYPFQIRTLNENVRVAVELPSGVVEISFPHKRLFSRATPIVFLGTLGSTLFFMILALLFMRNQMRPIQRLATAAESFGKGQALEKFKPEGASEVRKAAAAFITMQKRITKHMHQRTKMLAAISHDLCTPITRMKLQLEIMPGNKPEKEALTEDIRQMEQLIKAYLDFVQGKTEEKIVPIKLEDFFVDLLQPFLRTGAKIKIKKDKNVSPIIKTQPFSLKRALTNLVQNSLKYGTKTLITISQNKKNLIISVQDNGPGVPDLEKKNIFQPFYRMDKSRNVETGGAGLGLTIARDVVLGLGGHIELGDSIQLKGLDVRCYLPQES